MWFYSLGVEIKIAWAIWIELNLKLSLCDSEFSFEQKLHLSVSAGMSHESKSPSLGMISAAPCSMATVSPLTPSPISGAVVANGSPAAQSAHSGFAAALRKLAKQAEEPRGERLSSALYPSVFITSPVMPWWRQYAAVVSRSLLVVQQHYCTYMSWFT